MRASIESTLRVCREIAYGVDGMHATMHGRRPAAPAYAPVEGRRERAVTVRPALTPRR